LRSREHRATVKSVSRAADILFCLSNGITTVTDIARHCNLSKSTVHRLLKALKESYLVTQEPNNPRYHLGPLMIRISSNPQTTHNYLVTIALEEMKRLWDVVEDTVTLNIMIGIQYVRLHEIPSKHDLRVIDQYDPVGPIFVGATARVLLSQLNDEELKAALNTLRISRVTDRSMTDKKAIMEHAKKIRKQGYAISYGERIAGSLCVSAPIKNYFWPAALSVVGPETRLKPELDTNKESLIASADRITGNIGKFIRQRG
jgi:DNA-binding IclR family transcriptional regulator